jgi:hypothetical protein
VSPNFYRLPELLRNSGHSKVVSKERRKRRAGKSMFLAFKGKEKRANREEQTKNSIQQLSTHQVHGGTLPSCANKFLFYE